MGDMNNPETVTVARADLEYLLAHYADEVHGTPVPDREHWRLPLLGETCARLAGALAGAVSSEGGWLVQPGEPARDYFARHGDDIIPVRLIDLASAVARMRQVSGEPGFEMQGIVHERIFTCDLPRLESYLPGEARREMFS